MCFDLSDQVEAHPISRYGTDTVRRFGVKVRDRLADFPPGFWNHPLMSAAKFALKLRFPSINCSGDPSERIGSAAE